MRADLAPATNAWLSDFFPQPGCRVASIASPADFGEFNGDGSVDAADYLVWRKNNGSPTDYNLWRAHYGQSITGSGSSIESASVPEPSSLALLLVLGVILASTPAQTYHGKCHQQQ